jgi:pimeloyl-ACP methyl ester carboxylesterase
VGERVMNLAVPGGLLEVRTVGDGPTVLFLHGLLVNGHVWDPLIAGLADHLTMVLPDLPLGGHRSPLQPDADCSLGTHAERVIVLARQLPQPLVLVGSDTGGAIAQLAVTKEPELFSRLVLLPSDAFKNCPPKLLLPVRWLAAVPGSIAAIAFSLRWGFVVRIMMALVSKHRSDPAFLTRLIGGLRTDPGVRRDLTKLLRQLRSEVTDAVAKELHRFAGPVLIAWTTRDPLFPHDHAERLAGCFGQASVVLAEDSRAFISIDQPEWLSVQLLEFLGLTPTAS